MVVVVVLVAVEVVRIEEVLGPDIDLWDLSYSRIGEFHFIFPSKSSLSIYPLVRR